MPVFGNTPSQEREYQMTKQTITTANLNNHFSFIAAGYAALIHRISDSIETSLPLAVIGVIVLLVAVQIALYRLCAEPLSRRQSLLMNLQLVGAAVFGVGVTEAVLAILDLQTGLGLPVAGLLLASGNAAQMVSEKLWTRA